MRYIRVMPWILTLLLLNACGGDTQPISDPAESVLLAEPSTPAQPAVPASPSETNTEEGLAREAVTQFLAATKAADIDALTALTDVPFLLDGEVFTEVEELRPQLARMLEKGELLSRLTFEIREVIAFETIAQEMGGEVGDFLRRNLRDGDRILIVDILLPEEKPDRYAHYVRIQDGAARIVGLLNLPNPRSE